MKDPYEVLGIQRGATEAEVKAAYRQLVKKYHPDNYTDSPLQDLAEEKMKEINGAYETILKELKNGGSGSYGGSGGYSGSTRYQSVRIMIQQNRLDEAEQTLDSEQGDHNAEWYFLRGMCYYKRGWAQQAAQYFQRAVQMDPGNQEYRQAVENVSRQQSYGYGGYNTPQYGSGSDCGACDICSALMCMNCLCNCCR